MKQWLLILLLLVCTRNARADRVGYGGLHEIAATNGNLTCRHVHNWESKKLDSLFSDLTHHQRFFSAANDFSFVELRDGDKVLFRSPSPALTHLWISPDSQFLVGLSRIKLYNPYQLVVWQRDGTLLHHEHISDEVAKLSPQQKRDFAKRFPKADKFLAGRYFTHDNKTYLDYSILGVPNAIGKGAWDYLYPLRVKHPYSDDFGESVTNIVEWFDREHPQPSIVGARAALGLSLRSPSGKQMIIPLTK